MNCKIAILTAACLMTSVHGLRAQDTAQPTVVDTAPTTLPTVPMKKVPFVGIFTLPINSVESRDLSLPEGMGLRIAEIAPTSPAETSGLQHNDILVKLNDQLLCNPQQLQTLIRSHQKGESVTFVLRRDGKELSLPIVLGEGIVPAIPQGMLIIRGKGTPAANQVMNGMPIDPRTLAELHQSPSGGVIQASMEIQDNENSITTRTSDGRMEVTAKDLKGNVVYDGPVVLTNDGKVDMDNNKDVPKNILEKLQRSVTMTHTMNITIEATAPATQPSDK